LNLLSRRGAGVGPELLAPELLDEPGPELNPVGLNVHDVDVGALPTNTLVASSLMSHWFDPH
jgi:hypothetical protein